MPLCSTLPMRHSKAGQHRFLEKVRLLDKQLLGFLGVLGFSVQRRPDTKLRPAWGLAVS